MKLNNKEILEIAGAITYQARISEIEASYQNMALSDYLPSIYDKIDSDGIESITNIELRRVRN